MNKLINKALKELSYQTSWYVTSPEFLSLMITLSCNFHCSTCSLWQKTNLEELDEASWKNIVNKLTSVLKPSTFVEINGGEPLMRKNLTLFLVKELKKYFTKVALNSNGLLINEKIIRKLKSNHLDIIKISFYSLNEKIHNHLRGHKLAYNQAKKAIEIINKEQLNLEIGLLITAQNIQGAPKLIEYLQKLPNTSIVIQPLDEKIESVKSKNQGNNLIDTNLWPNKNEVNILFDYILQNNKNIKNSPANIEAIRQYYLNPNHILKYRCFAGQRNLVIRPNGDVALCFKSPKIGNIKKQDLKEILKKATNERKQIKKCQKYCRIIGCNFSRGLKEFIQKR